MILSERHKEIGTGLVIAGVFLAGLGLAEAALRLLQRVKFGTENPVESSELYRVDPQTGLRRPVPGSKHGQARVNALGFRGPEILVPKPVHTIRLVFVGSSTTFDSYADERSNWAHLTWSHLEAALPACKFDYVNAGVPGSNAEKSERQFRFYVAPLQPDVVVFLPTEFSAALDNLALKQHLLAGAPEPPSWLVRHSVFWSGVKKNIEIIRLQRGARQERGKLQFADAELVPDMERGISAYVATAGRTAPVVAVVALDGRLRKDQTSDEQVRAANTALFYRPYVSISGFLRAAEIHRGVVRAVSEKLGAVLIDVGDKVPGDARHYMDSLHFTSNGSAIMAHHVSQSLLQAPAILALVREHCSAAGPVPGK